MSEIRYSVVSKGTCTPGADPGEVRRNLAARFRLNDKTISAIMEGRRMVLKKDLSREEAARYKKALEAAGLACAVTAPRAAPETGRLSVDELQVACPRCGHRQARAESCSKCGVIMARAAARAAKDEARSRTLSADNRLVEVLSFYRNRLKGAGFKFLEEIPPAALNEIRAKHRCIMPAGEEPLAWRPAKGGGAVVITDKQINTRTPGGTENTLPLYEIFKVDPRGRRSSSLRINDRLDLNLGGLKAEDMFLVRHMICDLGRTGRFVFHKNTPVRAMPLCCGCGTAENVHKPRINIYPSGEGKRTLFKKAVRLAADAVIYAPAPYLYPFFKHRPISKRAVKTLEVGLCRSCIPKIMNGLALKMEFGLKEGGALDIHSVRFTDGGRAQELVFNNPYYRREFDSYYGGGVYTRYMDFLSAVERGEEEGLFLLPDETMHGRLVLEFDKRRSKNFLDRRAASRKHLKNAVSFAPEATEANLVGMYDRSFLGNGKKGVVFTEDEVFWNLDGVKARLPYSEIDRGLLVPEKRKGKSVIPLKPDVYLPFGPESPKKLKGAAEFLDRAAALHGARPPVSG